MLMTKYLSKPATPVRDRSPHSITMAASNCPSHGRVTPGCRARPETSGTAAARDRRPPAARLLPSCAQRERHGQLRADGVAVGSRVRGDDEALPLENGVADGGDRVQRSSGSGVVGVRRARRARRARRRSPSAAARRGPGGRCSRRTRTASPARGAGAGAGRSAAA